MDPGDTDLLMGTLMDITDFTDANKDVLISGGVPATVRPSLWESPKPHLKQTVSCQRLPSRKQLVSLLTQRSVVRKTISLDSRKMLSSVRLVQLVLVWLATVTWNHKQINEVEIIEEIPLTDKNNQLKWLEATVVEYNES